VIYRLLEDLEKMAEAYYKPIHIVRSKIGEAVVRRVFDIKGVGVVAGSYVTEGRFVRNGIVVAYRGVQKFGEGKIVGLQRDKKTVKEVHTGFEFGFVVDSMTDWQVGDRVDCFIETTQA
jgi:translation initiation factor IF-2